VKDRFQPDQQRSDSTARPHRQVNNINNNNNNNNKDNMSGTVIMTQSL